MKFGYEVEFGVNLEGFFKCLGLPVTCLWCQGGPFSWWAQMKLVLLLFWGRVGHLGSTENFCTFAKVSYLYLKVFFMLSCGKTKGQTKSK